MYRQVFVITQGAQWQRQHKWVQLFPEPSGSTGTNCCVPSLLLSPHSGRVSCAELPVSVILGSEEAKNSRQTYPEMHKILFPFSLFLKTRNNMQTAGRFFAFAVAGWVRMCFTAPMLHTVTNRWAVACVGTQQPA